ncbi:MAG TPA: molybdopterin cofactor-binding domain-containing protein [Burkholderiales bacterium]
MSALSRRSFLKTAGALVLGVHLPARAQAGRGEINAWVMVLPNEQVIVRYARSEMGQGSMTAAAQLVAEELECDWRRVRVDYADSNEQLKRKRVWGPMSASGSRTIRESHQRLRAAGASAREMLVAAAAQGWGVAAAECRAAGGVITHAASERRISFGRVAAAAAKLEAPKQLALKPQADWKVAGRPLARVDIPDIVTGRTRYGIDTQLPNMVYAAIAQCPVPGGHLRSVDEAPARGRRGVLRVVAMDDYVAVIADNWWRAAQALQTLKIEWDGGVNASLSSEAMRRELSSAFEPDTAAAVMKAEGDVDKALAPPARVLEAEYATPFLAHATLEPPSCTAVVKHGQVDVWTSTQDAEATHAAAAAAAGVAPENVYVHRTPVGGGFGRRLAQDYTAQGVAIAKALNGVPVNLIWAREEDLQHDQYRPANLVRLKAALDETGNLIALQCRVAGPVLKDVDVTAALADQPYSISNLRVEFAARSTAVPIGYWRGAAHSQNPFVRECFIDELAQAAKRDPLDYRLALLPENAKERAVLEAAAKAAGWRTPPAQGVHRGIAVTEVRSSYTAAVAELSLREKKIELKRLVVALDPGRVVNPDNAVAQVQGGAAFALSALLWGEITFKDGRVEQASFNDQRLLRLAEMPPIEVILVASGGFWGGVGEAGGAAVVPAIVNALSVASGERIRALPLKKAGFDLS